MVGNPSERDIKTMSSVNLSNLYCMTLNVLFFSKNPMASIIPASNFNRLLLLLTKYSNGIRFILLTLY